MAQKAIIPVVKYRIYFGYRVKYKGDNMVQMFQQSTVAKGSSRWLPAVLAATVALYFVGYVDGVAQGSFLGGGMAAVHEVFHHARHIALMCH